MVVGGHAQLQQHSRTEFETHPAGARHRVIGFRIRAPLNQLRNNTGNSNNSIGVALVIVVVV